MKLSLAQPYLSIKSFSDTDLPAFTIVTGKNGSGKTHLLQAIKNGAIRIEGVADPNQDVRYFDWTNLVPNEASAFDSSTLATERFELLSTLKAQTKKATTSLFNACNEMGIGKLVNGSLEKALSITLEDLVDRTGEAGDARRLHNGLNAAIQNSEDNLLSRIGDKSAHAEILRRIRSATGRSFLDLTDADLKDGLWSGWGSTELFQQSFSRLFVAYRDLALENMIVELAHNKDATRSAPLSDAEFFAKYSSPPWDFVNSVFSNAGLDFEIDLPDPYRYGPYSPTLRKKSSGDRVQFNSLSSGEKVLMSFALCIYYSQDRRQLISFPKVLLFDEIDAPLHPCMSRTLLNAISSTLVEEHGIEVILATHSASTVAMAPEGAVHIQSAEDSQLYSVSNQKALNVLTEDIPTLAVSFDGRRQVLVESETDARVFDKLYQSLKSQLDSERSLVFIGAGSKSRGNTEIGGGCDRVRSLVSTLADAGNSTLLGLIDWDLDNTCADRLHVLAQGERYSIENCLLDPLLLVALIARDAKTHADSVGISDETAFTALPWYDTEYLANRATDVQRQILGESQSQTTRVNYLGGFSLDIQLAYLEMNGHELEAKVLSIFPRLNKLNSHSGDLLTHIAGTIVHELPNLVPKSLFDSMKLLIEFDLQSD